MPNTPKTPEEYHAFYRSFDQMPFPMGVAHFLKQTEIQIRIGHSSFSSGVSSFGLELIFETIIPVQVTTTTQRYIPIPNAHVR